MIRRHPKPPDYTFFLLLALSSFAMRDPTMTLTNTVGRISHGTALPNQAAPEPSQAQMVTLPSTMVVGLGLGFVAAAMLVVVVTILIRTRHIRRAVREARGRGEHVSYRDMWRRWGGCWGLIFAHAEGMDENIRWTRRHTIYTRNLVTPTMYEAEVPRDQKQEFTTDDQPLAAAKDPCDDDKDIAVSVLIFMPARPDDHVDEDIPDLMLGTTHILTTQRLDFVPEQKEEIHMLEVQMMDPATYTRRAPWGVTWAPMGPP